MQGVTVPCITHVGTGPPQGNKWGKSEGLLWEDGSALSMDSVLHPVRGCLWGSKCPGAVCVCVCYVVCCVFCVCCMFYLCVVCFVYCVCCVLCMLCVLCVVYVVCCVFSVLCVLCVLCSLCGVCCVLCMCRVFCMLCVLCVVCSVCMCVVCVCVHLSDVGEVQSHTPSPPRVPLWGPGQALGRGPGWAHARC